MGTVAGGNRWASCGRSIAVAVAAALACGLAFPQANSGQADSGQDLTDARAHVDAARKALAQPQADADLMKQRATAIAARDEAEAAADRRVPQLDSVKQRLAELGTPAAGQPEPPDVKTLRAQLEKAQATLDGDIRVAKLTAIDAQQLVDQVGALRRSHFQVELKERTASLMSRVFWVELRANVREDAGRLVPIRDAFVATLARVSPWLWVGLVVAIAAVFALRSFVGRRAIDVIARRAPGGRLRRSLWAVVQVVLSVLVGAAIAASIRMVLSWGAPISPVVDGILDFAVNVLLFSAYIVGLGRALLSARRPTWRLSQLSDEVALKLRPMPWALAIILGIAWLADRLSTIVDASLSATVAINCLVALALATTLASMIVRVETLYRQALRRAPADEAPARARWQMPIAVVAWLIVAASVVFLLTGYVALGSFVLKQVVWIAIVGFTAYLLVLFVDDLAIALFTMPVASKDDGEDRDETGDRTGQVAVLVSGIGRMLIVVAAVILVLDPLGNGPQEIYDRAVRFRDGLSVGTLTLEPLAIVRAILAMVIGLWAVRALKRWLQDHYLPTTRLDSGLQLSTVTLFGYFGVVTAVAVSLSAAGIEFERIAWIASALSVGIGFGLQAVVQNFVSGLILLAERPIKVGDWIAVGDVEGDVERINVRATEIVKGDRSTVMVPNSELITKVVRNVTRYSPLGLVQIKLPMPLDTDAAKARDLILAVFTESTDLVDKPAPGVSLDGIGRDGLVFNATGFVASPRLAYGVRSKLMFEVLARLRDAQLPLSKPAPLVLRDVPAADAAGPVAAA